MKEVWKPIPGNAGYKRLETDPEFRARLVELPVIKTSITDTKMVQTATGEALDHIGDSLGCQRRLIWICE